MNSDEPETGDENEDAIPVPKNPLFSTDAETRGEILQAFDDICTEDKSLTCEQAAEKTRRRFNRLGRWPELSDDHIYEAIMRRDRSLRSVLDHESRERLKTLGELTGMSAESVLSTALVQHLRAVSPDHPLVRDVPLDAHGELRTTPQRERLPAWFPRNIAPVDVMELNRAFSGLLIEHDVKTVSGMILGDPLALAEQEEYDSQAVAHIAAERERLGLTAEQTVLMLFHYQRCVLEAAGFNVEFI